MCLTRKSYSEGIFKHPRSLFDSDSSQSVEEIDDLSRVSLAYFTRAFKGEDSDLDIAVITHTHWSADLLQHSIQHCSPDSPPTLSESPSTSLYSAPVFSSPEPMGRLRRSARLLAARSGEASISRASSSPSHTERLPPRCSIQGQKRKKHASSSTSQAKRLPPRCGFQEQIRRNQASSSTSQANNSLNSVNSKKSAKCPASGVSAAASETTVHGLEKIAIPPCDLVRVALPASGSKEYKARVEAIAMVISMANEKLMRESKNWNLNWSCSLRTHDTDILKTIWC